MALPLSYSPIAFFLFKSEIQNISSTGSRTRTHNEGLEASMAVLKTAALTIMLYLYYNLYSCTLDTDIIFLYCSIISIGIIYTSLVSTSTPIK